MSRSVQYGLVLGALLVMAVTAGQGGAQECPDLPQSQLRVERLQADHVTEHTATPEEIARLVNSGSGRAPHPLMAIANEIDTHFVLVHRLVASPDGGNCDAPELVTIRFGIISRHVFLAPQAAMESCVRETLLTHEADHNRALNAAVSAFIRQHRAELARELVELMGKRASGDGAAEQAFEAALNRVLARMLDQFKTEQVGQLRQIVDSTTRLAALRRSCNGRIGELEKSVWQGEQEL